MDTIGKKLWESDKSFYYYKKSVRILPLAMVDDIIAVSECGISSLELNTFINSSIELKKLRFHIPDRDGRSKCHKLHVGRHNMC